MGKRPKTKEISVSIDKKRIGRYNQTLKWVNNK